MEEETRNINRTGIAVKLLYIGLLVFGMVALLVAWDTPAAGYEASIYEKTPAILWAFVFISICVTVITTLLLQHNKKLFLFGLFLNVYCYVILVALYIIRGYYMWDVVGDVATHDLYITGIITTGQYAGSLFYPVQHIYAAAFIGLTGVSLAAANGLIALLFDILYVPFIYVFGRLFLNRRESWTLAIIGCIFVNGIVTIFAPSLLSSLYLPLVLFIFLKYARTSRLSWGVLSVIMVVLYAPFHIMTAAVLSLILIGFCAGIFIKGRLDGKATVSDRYRNVWVLPLLLIIWLITWINSFSIFQWSLSNVFNLIALASSSYLSGVGSNVSYAQSYGFNVLDYIVKTEGLVILYIAITFLSIVPVYFARKKGPGARNGMLIAYVPIVLLLGFAVVMLVQSSGISPLRVVIFILIFCTVCVAYVLSGVIDFLAGIRNRYLSVAARAVLGVILVAMFVNGLLILYPSTYNLTTTFQSTISEIDTMKWVLENKNIDSNGNILSIIDDPTRYNDLLMTGKGSVYTGFKQKIPWHFDYNNNSTFGPFYNQKMYLVLTDRDVSYYRDLFPQMAPLRFDDSDYARLELDPSLSKVYCTKETTIWYLK